ncbi:MAG: sigma-54-dependent Fis family transcriptional regulator [Magnetococcales bacterium]|nr:sigma-54-dependent Fis family transcriptional regulator [Magnetococcales bacterium]
MKGGHHDPIVLVDDEEEILFSAGMLLRTAGLGPVESFSDGRELLPYLEQHPCSVVVLDLIMPHVSGVDLLGELAVRHPETPVVMMTAVQEIEKAVSCMKSGAYDYLVKPVDESRFIGCIRRALETRQLRSQVGVLKKYLLSDALEDTGAFAGIITQSRNMRAIFQYTEAIAASSEAVLVHGETGVGKELLVRALHRASGREGDLVALNVAGLDDNMLSDTLFGHRKGAFSGADRPREGMIAKAEGGTLFLDEIGDMSPKLQVKMLRLLQERKYYPLGSDSYLRTDARVVCATNRNLKLMMAEGLFRADLYYRLAAHQIRVPPLRERLEDIPLLTGHFLETAARDLNKGEPTPPPELFQLLQAYHFPGNIRELRAMVFDAVANHPGGVLSLNRFREAIIDIEAGGATRAPLESRVEENPFRGRSDRLPTLIQAERFLLEAAIDRTGGNKSQAAALLGISRQVLNYKLKREGSS